MKKNIIKLLFLLSLSSLYQQHAYCMSPEDWKWTAPQIAIVAAVSASALTNAICFYQLNKAQKALAAAHLKVICDDHTQTAYDSAAATREITLRDTASKHEAIQAMLKYQDTQAAETRTVLETTMRTFHQTGMQDNQTKHENLQELLSALDDKLDANEATLIEKLDALSAQLDTKSNEILVQVMDTEALVRGDIETTAKRIGRRVEAVRQNTTLIEGRFTKLEKMHNTTKSEILVQVMDTEANVRRDIRTTAKSINNEIKTRTSKTTKEYNKWATHVLMEQMATQALLESVARKVKCETGTLAIVVNKTAENAARKFKQLEDRQDKGIATIEDSIRQVTDATQEMSNKFVLKTKYEVAEQKEAYKAKQPTQK
jgi:hypothetical protein